MVWYFLYKFTGFKFIQILKTLFYAIAPTCMFFFTLTKEGFLEIFSLSIKNCTALNIKQKAATVL